MSHKRKPKVDDEVIVFHDGELKTGKVTDVRDIESGWPAEGITFIFRVLTKRKTVSPNPEYVDFSLRANSFTLNPEVNANIRWAPTKTNCDMAWVFYTVKEYETWVRNEYKYKMYEAQSNFEGWKKLYESEIDIKLSEFKI